MTQSAWTRNGQPVDAGVISTTAWELMKQTTKLGDFVLPCCSAPAVLKTSINGVPFFAHLSDECATAPETKWHKAGKAAVLAALDSLGIHSQEEAPGQTPSGARWEADVLFTSNGRTIAIELQRSYQHLREYVRRQQRYTESGVECYWLVRLEPYRTLVKATARLLLQREFGNVWPANGIGSGLLPEFPVAMLNTDGNHYVLAGPGKSADMQSWIIGLVEGTYQYRDGSWTLG